jgi:hypothetical protein
MDNPEKLAIYGTQDEEKQSKPNNNYVHSNSHSSLLYYCSNR